MVPKAQHATDPALPSGWRQPRPTATPPAAARDGQKSVDVGLFLECVNEPASGLYIQPGTGLVWLCPEMHVTS